MIDPLDKEINVDEIMERIREEVRRRKGLSQPENFQENEQAPSQPQPIQPMPASPPSIQQTSAEHSFDHFLWEFGRKHKKIVKKIPILSSIAKKQHQRLLHKFISFSSAPPPSYSSPVNFDVLPYYINYHGFLEQAKKGEGLKGRVKFYLFKLIRFFGWWQEQINRALYQELITQKTRLGEKERWIQDIHHQQSNRLTEELNKRDSVVHELKNNLISLGQSKDELYREIEGQKVKVERAEKQFKETLDQQLDSLQDGFKKRDKMFENKLSILDQAKESLCQKLTEQNNKIDEIRNRFESHLERTTEEIKYERNRQIKIHEEIFGKLSQLQQAGEELNQKLSVQANHLKESEKSAQCLFNQGLEGIRAEFNREQESLKRDIESANNRLASLIELKSNLQHIFQQALKDEEMLPDTIYADFENQFRGSREEIKERFKVYLPFLKETSARTNHSLSLDLGCGRGEWVELLKENGYPAKGVDSNRIMVKQCRENGLDVTEHDAVDYLKNQPSNHFSAITGFHLLEHLSLKTMVSLFDEALRVLKPMGIAIFETPNPENLMVATNNFYLDPTHRHLLPPALLNFLLKSRGFKKTEIIRLHPRIFSEGEEKNSITLKSVLSLLNKEQDYSVIGYKE